jgi:predicted acyl esterase
VQYGLGERGPKSRANGRWVCGDETLSDAELAKNRTNFGDEILAHPLDDDYHKGRSPVWDKINVPLLTAANWGGQGLHPRGNFEGFVRSKSKDKWLEAHGLEHWTHFYTDYGRQLQLRFFNRFLKGEEGDWKNQPKVQLQIRHFDRFVERHENEWPLARTNWTKMYLSGSSLSFSPGSPKTIAFDAMGDGVTFVSEPLEKETEITGPIAARLKISSSTADADLFLVLRVFTPDLREVTFMGAIDPHTPVAQGWLRASHRKLDAKLSTEYRPYHSHDEKQPLSKNEVVSLAIEVLPTCIVVPAGCRLALTVRGKDYEWQKTTGAKLSNFKNELLGCGPFLHNEPRDRPAAVFGGKTTLHLDANSYLLLPVIPPK